MSLWLQPQRGSHELQPRVCTAKKVIFCAESGNVPLDIDDVLCKVIFVTYAVIRESGLPDVTWPLERSSSTEGKATFDKLDCAFDWYVRANEKVDVVWHENEVVQIEVNLMALYRIEEEVRPALMPE